MLGDLLRKTSHTKTGKTAIAGVVVSAITITIGFTADFVRTFELSENNQNRVALIEKFFTDLSGVAIPALFAGTFIFRGVSSKGFADEDNDGVDDRLQEVKAPIRQNMGLETMRAIAADTEPAPSVPDYSQFLGGSDE